MEIHKMSFIPSLLFLWFPMKLLSNTLNATASSRMVDEVTSYAMHRIFNHNLYSSAFYSQISRKKIYIYWQFLIAYGGALHRPLIRSTTHWDCTQTRHPVRHICCGEVPTISKLVERSDDKLFANILYNQFHVLYNSLPEEMVLPYNFRCRPHNRQLVNKTSRLADASFIVRMLYY